MLWVLVFLIHGRVFEKILSIKFNMKMVENIKEVVNPFFAILIFNHPCSLQFALMCNNYFCMIRMRPFYAMDINYGFMNNEYWIAYDVPEEIVLTKILFIVQTL